MKQLIPEVSIIVPVYNVEKYLPRFLNSMVNQKFKNFEVILIDDGSNDNSFELCKRISEKDCRFKSFHQKNQGTGAARNVGLDHAKGKYIYFCDPDDYLSPQLLEDNLLIAKQYNANMVLFGYYAENESGKLIKKVLPPPKKFLKQEDFIDNFKDLYENDLLSSLWNKLYLREALQGLYFEHVRTGQDNRFNLKLFESLDKIYCNPTAYYHYIINRSNSAQNKAQFDKLRFRAQEVNSLSNLIKIKWNKNGSEWNNFLNDQNIIVASEALKLLQRGMFNYNESINNLNSLIKDYNLEKNLIIKKSNKLSTNYRIFIIKNRNSRIIWHLDKMIENIFYHFKNK